MVMLRNSPHLIAIIAAYVIGLVAYNYVGQQVSPMAGVASRTWLETLRTLACWFLAACLHHGNPSVFEGESLTWQMSTMQLGGFVMGTLGTLLYGRGDAAERQHIFERRLRAESDGGVAAPDLPGGSSRRSSRGRRERKPPRDSNRHELPRSGNSASGTDDDTGNEWSGAEETLLSPGRTSVDLAGRPPGSPASAFARTSAGREAAETVAAIARDGGGDGSPGTQPAARGWLRRPPRSRADTSSRRDLSRRPCRSRATLGCFRSNGARPSRATGRPWGRSGRKGRTWSPDFTSEATPRATTTYELSVENS